MFCFMFVLKCVQVDFIPKQSDQDSKQSSLSSIYPWVGMWYNIHLVCGLAYVPRDPKLGNAVKYNFDFLYTVNNGEMQNISQRTQVHAV